jgi:lipopolysaccharide export system protein LptA
MKLAQDRRRAEFERQVVFADEGRRVACDRLVLELDESGKELRRVAASGAVSFSDGERQIECKTLSVRMAGASDKDRAAVQQVEAAGDVKFRGQGASGVGEKLAISQAANDLRLTGSPALLQRGRESFRGAEIVARDGGARVESPGPGVMETALASGDAAQPADPVRVAWGKRMAFFQADDRAVFEGGVVLTRGRQSLRAETVEVRPQAQVFRAPGPGSMEVEAPAEGDQPAGQMEVSWRGSAEFVESERRAAFLGQVQMKRGDQEIRAESVAIALTEARQVKGLEAQGGVSLRDARRKVSAEGDRLAWDMAADNGKLWGADKKPASLSQPDQRPILADWIEFRDRFETIRMAGGRLE